ncbi:MAG: tRNA (adenosine(37)-N6)-threonylcarbamoyltransferase complex ATPase subunit type 1 TsaE [Oscillospiraceae bacterium]
MREYISGSVEETENIAKEFAKELKAGDVIAYKGNLGAGKTAFTRGLAKGLGLDCEVSSPTFALVHEYRGKDITLYHFDMYRINDFNDLYSTGYFDYLDLNQILAIEWSENIEGILEENTIFVDIQTIDENTRKITIVGGNRF